MVDNAGKYPVEVDSNVGFFRVRVGDLIPVVKPIDGEPAEFQKWSDAEIEALHTSLGANNAFALVSSGGGGAITTITATLSSISATIASMSAPISTISATLANVTNIAGLDGETEIIDVTSHDSSSAYREKVASFIDAGQLTLDVNFDPNSATHRATSGGVMWLRD